MGDGREGGARARAHSSAAAGGSSETATGNGVIVGGRAATNLVVIIFVRCSGRSGEEVAVLSASNAEADILPRAPKVPNTTHTFSIKI